MFGDIINQFIKSRKDEAVEKQISKKARCILQFMGNKIIHHGYFSSEEWEIMTNDIFEYDEVSRQIGWLFQAYPFGKEFEIQHLIESESLTITWYSAIVYQETDGSVAAYSPGEWECFLNNMYKIASAKEKSYLEKSSVDAEKQTESKTGKLLDFLQKTWGIKI